jgi:hypothetical protein
MSRLLTLVVISIWAFPVPALALVNINTASLAELDTLPGVGPATAEKIVAARPFSATSQIQNVQGIGGPGSKTYDDIIGLITVSGSTTLPPEENEEEGDEGEVQQTTATSTSKKGDTKIYLPVHEIDLYAPEIAYVNQLVEFKVGPDDGRKDRLVRYTWNFGDGETDAGTLVTHSYRHPGTYVVVVEGYYMKEFFTARAEIKVLTPTISFTDSPNGDVIITNLGEEEIDLFGMTLRGRNDFVFPKHTILLPNASLTIPLPGQGQATLSDQAGVAVGQPQTVAAVTSAPRVKPATLTRISPAITMPLATATTATSTAVDSLGPNQSLAAAAALSPESRDFWPYLGLMGLVLLGLFGLGSGRLKGE